MMADETDLNEKAKQRPSAAEIAALIDGRLSDDARAEVMRQLGESEEDLDIALDAAAAIDGLDEGRREGARVSSISTQRRKRLRAISFATVSLAAAAVAVIVLRAPRTNVESASEMVSTLSSHEPLPADWNYSPWPAQRGDENVSDSSLLIRIGVRTTDLEFALRAGDPNAARFAREIDTMLEGVPGGSVVGAVYQQLAAKPDSDGLLTDARHALASLPRQDLITLGAWLEAARIAAERHDEKWFKNEPNQRMLQELMDRKKVSRTDVESLRDSIPNRVQWSRLVLAFEGALSD
jgi:hypothetical protein